MLYDYSGVYSAMDTTVEYIRDLLSLNPSNSLIGDQPTDNLTPDLIDDPDQLDFQANTECTDKSLRCAAVDGGQGHILKNTSFSAGVYRAGYVLFEGRQRIDEFSLPLKLVNLTAGNYRGEFSRHFSEICGKGPGYQPLLNECLGELRRACEECCLQKILAALYPGDLLLIDGSLRGAQGDSGSGLKDILKEAGKRSIDIAAVTKFSSLLWRGGANYAATINKLADQKMGNESWHVKIDRADKESEFPGNIYIAGLNRFASQAFRIDLSGYNQTSAASLFGRLERLADDAYFLGYPYPLAAVHQMVRLSPDELLSFNLRLKDKALQAGIEANRWDILFEDYHKILNHDQKPVGQQII